MARSRDFDLEQALDGAVELFWRQGYASTSVRQLCEAMGIQPGSFYAAFESKEACFQRSLERYLTLQVLPIPPGPEAIRAWFDAITHASRGGKGCLLVNSAVELPNLDADSQRVVAERIHGLERFFGRCLAGRDDAKERAEDLAASVIAIHVMARSGAKPSKLKGLAKRALSAAQLG
ncbi:MAG: TetR/AcrR family transcriptional regulator [Polyangiaceae bacterium]|nr:TetR/AcrR family transcriptional regulator [Myxococcales bacterium]MCB9587568.1 TetR/AcrR family transcriptional regulator [Polyangiaceae bacterium]MCB9605635.1 TetR/AcrR family transcriptional regulator [Polyangiaceae bacterium]